MKLKAELWDKIQYLFRNYYDRMIHGVYYLEGKLDKDILAKTIKLILQRVPVLRSRYVANHFKPYWKVEEGNFVDDVLSFKETMDLEKDLDRFITSRFESNRAPQIRINLFRNKTTDTLAILVNHQCMDGSDLKELVNKIVEVYNSMLKGDTGEISIKSGSRANEQVYSSMSLENKKKAKGMYKNISKTKHKIAFPLTEKSKDDKPMIIKHKINAKTFVKLKQYGKSFNSTINDVLLAAYFRTLYKMIDINENQSITIPCMTDLRKHIKTGQTQGFTNLTCLIPCTIDSVGQEFSTTLKKVSKEMSAYKNDLFVGLSAIPLLELAYKVAPSSIAELLIKAGYTNPFIGMSNIGIIDDSKLVWGNVKTKDAFMTGAIKYKPYMQLALTTFKQEITLTISIYGTKDDKKVIEKFFKLYDDELKNAI